MNEKKYIKGLFRSKFSGIADDVVSNQTHLANKLFEIHLTQAKIDEAEWVDSYEVEERRDTLYLPYLAGVEVFSKEQNSGMKMKQDFVHVWITDISIEHSVKQGNQSVGELSGYIFVAVPEKNFTATKQVVKERISQNADPSKGCIPNALMNILMLLGLGVLLLFFWCFLFGHCSWNGLLYGCKECEPCVTKRDTIVVYRDTTQADSSKIKLGTGDLQFSLFWNSYEDLDLVVITPSGKAVCFQSKDVEGGVMDVDMNAVGMNATSSPVENIFWEKGKVPAGKYTCFVSYYRRAKASDSPENFKLRVKIKDTEQIYEGAVQEAINDRSGTGFDPYHLDGQLFATKVITFDYK
jgi:hypothetical protein